MCSIGIPFRAVQESNSEMKESSRPSRALHQNLKVANKVTRILKSVKHKRKCPGMWTLSCPHTWAKIQAGMRRISCIRGGRCSIKAAA